MDFLDLLSAFSEVRAEEQKQCMEIGACQAANPVIGMAFSMVAKFFRTGWHAYPERFRKALERCLVDAQRAQPAARECQVYARRGRYDHGLGRAELVDDPREECPCLVRVAECEEEVLAAGHGHRPQQQALDVVELKNE